MAQNVNGKLIDTFRAVALIKMGKKLLALLGGYIEKTMGWGYKD